jgi:hypothetical protein
VKPVKPSTPSQWDGCWALLASGYCVWLLYAAGLKYLMLSALLYAPGALVFAWALHEQQQGRHEGRHEGRQQARQQARPASTGLLPSAGFKPAERNLLWLLLALALTAAALLAAGGLSL